LAFEETGFVLDSGVAFITCLLLVKLRGFRLEQLARKTMAATGKRFLTIRLIFQDLEGRTSYTYLTEGVQKYRIKAEKNLVF
ncbi:MAG TPA: hypothetical protein VF476_17340, partial [Chitinophagaceae bacterium]